MEEVKRGRQLELKLVPESVEDLWHLKYILEKGDIVFSLTKRVSESSDKLRSDKEKVTVRIGIEVEKVEFQKFSNRLRITGRIVAGVEDSGYHTISITPGKELTIIKSWKKEQLERLRYAVESSEKPEVVIVTIEEGEAVIGVLRQWGVDEVAEIRKGYAKDLQSLRGEFFSEVYSALKNLNFEYLVIAGPGFTKEDFAEFLKERDKEIGEKIVLCDASSIGVRGFIEVLKRGVVDRIVGEVRLSKEAELLEKLMEEISKDGLAVYGLEDVKKAKDYGAIDTLLISDEFLIGEREKWDVDEFLREVENMGGKIVVFSSEFEPGKRLMALGGVAALLRFRID